MKLILLLEILSSLFRIFLFLSFFYLVQEFYGYYIDFFIYVITCFFLHSYNNIEILTYKSSGKVGHNNGISYKKKKKSASTSTFLLFNTDDERINRLIPFMDFYFSIGSIFNIFGNLFSLFQCCCITIN